MQTHSYRGCASLGSHVSQCTRQPFTHSLQAPTPRHRSARREHSAQVQCAARGSPSSGGSAETAELRQEAQPCQQAQQIAQVGEASSRVEQAREALATPQGAAAAVALAAVAGFGLRALFKSGSRTYKGDHSVGAEYDAWTNEGILEAYWGEHIHLGYYTDEERAAGYKKKDFKAAKYDFIDEMLRWSGADQPARVLDVGCGFGGTSRHLAKKFPNAAVEGITLSPAQVKRGTELAQEQGVGNVHFQVMDALKMTWPDNSFDLVWACESGEHMPDKKLYVEEMTRVLKPGGRIVIATWCQREDTPETPFTEKERGELQFLYDEWAHPHFISIEKYGRLMQGTGQLERVETADWTEPTLPSWRHSNWVGVYNPWPVILKLNPVVWYKVIREIVCIERMHRAFDSGLMRYGMMKAVKKA